jgi:hypothetical protein
MRATHGPFRIGERQRGRRRGCAHAGAPLRERLEFRAQQSPSPRVAAALHVAESASRAATCGSGSVPMRRQRNESRVSPSAKALGLGRKRSSTTLTVELGPGFRNVADALVRSGEVATIALEECNRRAAGLGPQNRVVRLARIEQAAAPPSRKKQGPGPVAHHVDVAGDADGCASGEYEGSSGPPMASAPSLR